MLRRSQRKSLIALCGDLIAFLQKLVQIPSLPGQEQLAQHFVADKLRSLGLEVEVFSAEFDDLKDHPAFCDDGVHRPPPSRG